MAKSAWRKEVEHLVDIFIDWKESPDEDAGRHGLSRMGMIADYHGEFPSSSGFHAVDKMEIAIRFLRSQHRDLPLIRAAMADLSKAHYDAVYSDRSHRGRTKVAIDQFHPDKPVEIHFGDEYIAELLGIAVRTYRERVTEGYRQIAEYCGYLQNAA